MNRIRMKTLLGALGAVAIAAAAPTVSASSHREAPLIANDPQADNTDLYAFKDVAGTNLVLVGCWSPLEEPGAGPNYNKLSDDVLYEFHITRGIGVLNDFATYQVRFTTAATPYVDPKADTPTPAGGNEFFAQITNYFAQTYTVTRVNADGSSTAVATNITAAPPNIGPNTTALVYETKWGASSSGYDATFQQSFAKATTEAGKVFSGPVDDPFFADVAGIFDLANLRPLAKKAGIDTLAGYNVHAIVLSIPLTTLIDTTAPLTAASDANLLGVWASSSRRKARVLRADGTTEGLGPWVQVSRLGLPLVNEALIGIQDKDKWNRGQPKDEITNFSGYYLNPVLVRDANFAGLYAAGAPLGALASKEKALETNRTDLVTAINLGFSPFTHQVPLATTGDVLRIDTSVASGFPNGRLLTDDVVDTMLSIILTGFPQERPSATASVRTKSPSRRCSPTSTFRGRASATATTTRSRRP